MAEERALSRDQVARRWNVSVETVKRAIQSGRLAAVKIEGQWRIYLSAVVEYERARRA